MEFSSRAENTSFRTELVERRTSFPALLLLKKKKYIYIWQRNMERTHLREFPKARILCQKLKEIKSLLYLILFPKNVFNLSFSMQEMLGLVKKQLHSQ